MIEVAFSNSFKRAYKRRISGIKEREKRFYKKLDTFRNDPFDQSLRTHKLSGKLQELWSFSIEYDLRVIFSFVEKTQVVFIDIGSHDEVY